MITQEQLQSLLEEYKNLIQFNENPENKFNQAYVFGGLAIFSVVGFMFYAFKFKENHDPSSMYLSIFIATIILVAMNKNSLNTAKDHSRLFQEFRQQVLSADTQQKKDDTYKKIKIKVNEIFSSTQEILLQSLMKQGIELIKVDHIYEIIAINIHAYLTPLIRNLTASNIKSQYECDDQSAIDFIENYKKLVSQQFLYHSVNQVQLEAVLHSLAHIVEQDWNSKSANIRPAF